MPARAAINTAATDVRYLRARHIDELITLPPQAFTAACCRRWSLMMFVAEDRSLRKQKTKAPMLLMPHMKHTPAGDATIARPRVALRHVDAFYDISLPMIFAAFIFRFPYARSMRTITVQQIMRRDARQQAGRKHIFLRARFAIRCTRRALT